MCSIDMNNQADYFWDIIVSVLFQRSQESSHLKEVGSLEGELSNSALHWLTDWVAKEEM